MLKIPILVVTANRCELEESDDFAEQEKEKASPSHRQRGAPEENCSPGSLSLEGRTDLEGRPERQHPPLLKEAAAQLVSEKKGTVGLGGTGSRGGHGVLRVQTRCQHTVDIADAILMSGEAHSSPLPHASSHASSHPFPPTSPVLSLGHAQQTARFPTTQHVRAPHSATPISPPNP